MRAWREIGKGKINVARLPVGCRPALPPFTRTIALASHGRLAQGCSSNNQELGYPMRSHHYCCGKHLFVVCSSQLTTTPETSAAPVNLLANRIGHPTTAVFQFQVHFYERPGGFVPGCAESSR